MGVTVEIEIGKFALDLYEQEQFTVRMLQLIIPQQVILGGAIGNSL